VAPSSDPRITVEAIFDANYLPQVHVWIEWGDGEANLFLEPEQARFLAAQLTAEAQRIAFEAALVEQLAAGGMGLGAIGVFIRELRQAYALTVDASREEMETLLPAWTALAAAGLKLPEDGKP
jgi:hypothetical protein